MPNHAILGATGGVGSAIVHSLLATQTPNTKINLLVRSKQKLLSLIPAISTPPSDITITIFEGSVSSPDTLSACLKDADCIYQCISAPSPAKPTTMAQDTVNAIVKVLEEIKSQAGDSYSLPTVLLNRSSALNPSIKVPISTPSHFLHWAIHNIYHDLSLAVDLLSTASTDNTLKYILLDAPNLFHPFSPDTKTGYEIVTEGAMTLAVNYADFGDAVVEVAGRREEYWGMGVGVKAKGEVVPAWGPNAWQLAMGTWGRLNPFG